jgi:hypothetical protein
MKHTAYLITLLLFSQILANAKSNYKDYKVIFNHDGWCVFSMSSKYQAITKPVSLSQIQGYVDEVADAGCDVMFHSPVLGRIPLWVSEIDTHWKDIGFKENTPNDSVVEKNYNRAKGLMRQHKDFLKLTLDRAHEKGMAYFVSWRMNECHDAAKPDTPIMSKFMKEHSEYKTGNIHGRAMREHTLNFAINEVRDEQFALLEEICNKYDIDGLELDFLRFAPFFKKDLAKEERFAIMTAHVRRIRKMLDKVDANLPICVRVNNRLKDVENEGLDLDTWVNEGLINMINISSWFNLQSDGDVESFRKAFPNTQLFAEMTHSTQLGKHIEMTARPIRKVTHEMYESTAYGFLERGADGISLFNFAYSRDSTHGHPRTLDNIEPDFDVLKRIADRSYLAKRPKHYVLNSGAGSPREAWQLPFTLVGGEKPIEIKIYVADDMEKARATYQFKTAVLRIQTKKLLTHKKRKEAVFAAYIAGAKLKSCIIEGELFEQPFREVIPESHDYYTDFEVPLAAIEKGWNQLSFQVQKGSFQVIRVELALYTL